MRTTKEQLEFVNNLFDLLQYANKYSANASLQLASYKEAMSKKQFNNPITFWTNEEKLIHKVTIKKMVKDRIKIRLKKEIEKLNELI